MPDDRQPKPTVQFPLCGLAYGDGDLKDRVLTCMAHGVVSAGKIQLERLRTDQADALMATAPLCSAPNSFPREQLRIVQLGVAYTGIHFAQANWVWQAAQRLEDFVMLWKSAGHKSPLARIP